MSRELHSGDGLERRLQALVWLLLLSFAAVAASLIYWSSLRASSILARDDNPRLVEAEQQILRGLILDREDQILAQTVGPTIDLFRSYPVPEAAPAVGYYSLRHGTAGIEAAFDAVLRGQVSSFWEEWWRQTLGALRTGQDVRLTLDARWQQSADELMDGQMGAAVLLTLPEGEIRVMASRPGYDPNRLDEQFDELIADDGAPLLNRVTQGQYQPGRILAPFLFAAGVDAGLVELDALASRAERVVQVDSISVACTGPPSEPATYGEALRHACPAPLLVVGEALSREGVAATWERFGLTSAPSLTIPTTTGSVTEILELDKAVLGQGELTVSPLQIALAWASLANGGRLPAPQLVAAVKGANDEWQPYRMPTQESAAEAAVAPPAARQVLEALRGQDELDSDSALAVEYRVPVLSGPGGTVHHWYLGLAPAVAPRYALVVVLEEGDSEVAKNIGRALLEMVADES